jgi:hypothetical protein
VQTPQRIGGKATEHDDGKGQIVHEQGIGTVRHRGQASGLPALMP